MPRPKTDKVAIGMRFGMLLVIAERDGSSKQQAKWQAQCDCRSKPIWLRTEHLASGRVQACGCQKHQRINLDHGHASHRAAKRKHTPTYKTWCDMRLRARELGIEVEPSWSEFKAFLSDMGEKPAGHRLDRDDYEFGYTADNCKWEEARLARANSTKQQMQRQ